MSLNNYNLQQCGLCGLHQGVKQKVDGEGALPCDVLLLGEAPGEEEDRTGRPFVGMAGRFLRECIVNSGLKKSGLTVRITNTVRCRPPGNRTPSVEEIGSCNVWTELELQLAQPQVIVALGGTAIGYFLDDFTIPKKKKVGDFVNKVYTYYKGIEPLFIPVVGSYHPAARQVGQRSQVERALRLAVSTIKGEGLGEKQKDYKLEYHW